MHHSYCRIFIQLAIAVGLAADCRGQDSEDLLRRGNALMQGWRLAEARKVFNSIRKGDAQYPAAQTLLGFLSLRLAALPQAEEAFKQALESLPESPAAHFGLGMTLAQRGLPEDASREYKLVFPDPRLGDKARVQWVQALYWAGKEQEAFSEARELAGRFPEVAAYQSLLGFFQQLRGQVKDAEMAFQRAVTLEPENLSNYFSLVSACRAQKNWEGALKWIRRALDLDANQPLLYEDLAEACQKLGKTDDANAARQEGQRKLNAELLYTRAAQARMAGRDGEAERALRECLKNNPRLSKAWSDLGEVLRQNHQLQEARKAYLLAMETDPSNLLPRLGLAATLQEEGDDVSEMPQQRPTPAADATLSQPGRNRSASDRNQDIQAILVSVIHAAPDNPDLLAYLGHMKESAGQGLEALEAYSEALRVDPLHVGALLGKARHTLAAGDPQHAISIFRRATDLEPSNIEAWRGLIQAQIQAKSAPEAEVSCKDCLTRNPGNFDCRELLAQLKLDSSDYREAAKQYQLVLRNGKSSKDILDSLAFSLMKLGEAGQAIGLFESSLKRYGPDAWVYVNLGHLHRSQGNYHAAIADYRRARQLSPRDPETSHNLGFCLYLARNYAAAVEPFQSALRFRPGWGLAHFNLAMVYWNLRQYALALAHARVAEEKGVQEASKVVEALSANLAPSMPRSMSVYRRKN